MGNLEVWFSVAHFCLQLIVLIDLKLLPMTYKLVFLVADALGLLFVPEKPPSLVFAGGASEAPGLKQLH
jgi:hypothetical protein